MVCRHTGDIKKKKFKNEKEREKEKERKREKEKKRKREKEKKRKREKEKKRERKKREKERKLDLLDQQEIFYPTISEQCLFFSKNKPHEGLFFHSK